VSRSRAVVCVVCVDKGDKGDVFKNRKDENNNYNGVALVGGRPAPGQPGPPGHGAPPLSEPAHSRVPSPCAPFQSTRSVRTDMTSKDSEKAQVSAELQQFIAQEQAKAQVRFPFPSRFARRILLSRFSSREAGPSLLPPSLPVPLTDGSRPSFVVPHSSSLIRRRPAAPADHLEAHGRVLG